MIKNLDNFFRIPVFLLDRSCILYLSVRLDLVWSPSVIWPLKLLFALHNTDGGRRHAIVAICWSSIKLVSAPFSTGVTFECSHIWNILKRPPRHTQTTFWLCTASTCCSMFLNTLFISVFLLFVFYVKRYKTATTSASCYLKHLSNEPSPIAKAFLSIYISQEHRGSPGFEV